jgi:hypothetical protein
VVWYLCAASSSVSRSWIRRRSTFSGFILTGSSCCPESRFSARTSTTCSQASRIDVSHVLFRWPQVDLTYVLLSVLGASAMYYVPLGREMCLWMGGVDASQSTGEKVLKEGNSVIVYPGGVPEIFRTDPNSKVVRPGSHHLVATYTLWILKRFHFAVNTDRVGAEETVWVYQARDASRR